MPVVGDSMAPTLRSGARIVLHRVEPDALAVGDVIAFRFDCKLVVHRIQHRDGNTLHTAGDNLGLMDPPVAARDVVGIVHDVASRPYGDIRLPATASKHVASAVHVWLIGASEQDQLPELPVGWTVTRRSSFGIGVAEPVLGEIVADVAASPCVGISEHAVRSVTELAAGTMPAGTRVIIGCSFGQLDMKLPGKLLPPAIADVHLRPALPGQRVDPTAALSQLARAYALSQLGSQA